MTTAGVAVTFSGMDTSCKGRQTAYEAWEPDKEGLSYDDFRLKMLSYAILAPNPHNKQPWRIDLREKNSMTLYIDPERLLPMTDPLHRQIYIGQGTFLETLNIAAKEFGYDPAIQLFPEGVDAVEKTGKLPVAVIRFVRAEEKHERESKDYLFGEIRNRATNRREYNDVPVTSGEIESLNKSYDGAAYPFQIITDTERIKAIADLMTDAMKIETYLDRTHSETVAMIRFNDEEVAKYRDGFGYANIGVIGITKFFAETFAGRSKAFGDSFKEKSVSATSGMTHSAKAFGIIFSKENSRIDQVEIGRRYARVHLTATQLGLAMHPMSQILQEYDEMSKLQKNFKEVIGSDDRIPQMLFRIGRADAAPHSPRRVITDYLKS